MQISVLLLSKNVLHVEYIIKIPLICFNNMCLQNLSRLSRASCYISVPVVMRFCWSFKMNKQNVWSYCCFQSNADTFRPITAVVTNPDSEEIAFPVPFDLPLQKYSEKGNHWHRTTDSWLSLVTYNSVTAGIFVLIYFDVEYVVCNACNIHLLCTSNVKVGTSSFYII